MTICYVHRAQSINPAAPVPHFRILTYDEPFPESTARGEAALAEGMALFRSEAKALAEVLYESLPGGTLDQLLREMLERKASQFIVRF